jgi:hypothetical protein
MAKRLARAEAGQARSNPALVNRGPIKQPNRIFLGIQRLAGNSEGSLISQDKALKNIQTSPTLASRYRACLSTGRSEQLWLFDRHD